MTNFLNMLEGDLKFLSRLLSEQSVADALHSLPLEYGLLLETYQNVWKEDSDEKHFIIYCDDVEAGWLKLNGLNGGDRAWLSMLVVSPEFQRRGLGASAVRFTEDYTRGLFFSELAIHTTTDNRAACALYKKLGYKAVEYAECTTADGERRRSCTFVKLL